MNKLTCTTLLLSAFTAACPGPDHPEPDDASSPAIMADAGATLDARPSGAPRPLDDAGIDAAVMAPAESGVLGDAARSAADLELERRTIEKFKMCGMFEASVDPAQYSIEDEYDRCAARCV